MNQDDWNQGFIIGVITTGNEVSLSSGVRSILDGLLSVSLTRIYPLFKMNFTELQYFPLMSHIINPLKANLTLFTSAPSLNQSSPSLLELQSVNFVMTLPDIEKPPRQWTELVPLAVQFSSIS